MVPLFENDPDCLDQFASRDGAVLYQGKGLVGPEPEDGVGGDLGLGAGAWSEAEEIPAQPRGFLGDDVGAHGQRHHRDVFR